MKIAIMGAMTEEVSLIADELLNKHSEIIGQREYHVGQINNHDVIVVFSRWGKVAASSTATTLINHFNVDLIIFTGVAGAISSELNIGDMVIANQLYQHDMDARPLFDKHQIPLTNEIYFKVDDSLCEKAKNAAEKFLGTDIKNHSIAGSLGKFGITSPKVITGKIASGDKFVSDEATRQSLIADVPDLQAVEMEGAAVAQICHEHDVKYLVIRTISDTANHEAAIDFMAFIKEVSNHYSKEVVMNYLRM